MATSPPGGPGLQKPLRLWPAVSIVVLQLILRVVGMFVPDAEILGMLGGLFGFVLLLLWWLLFSRAPWSERLGGLALMAVAAAAMRPLMHPSIQNGMMGRMFFVYAVPGTISLAFVIWAIASRGFTPATRRLTMAAAIVLGCGVWALARTNGISGGGGADLAWRWSETAEQRLLARGGDLPTPPSRAAAAIAAAPPEAKAPAAESVTAIRPAAKPEVPEKDRADIAPIPETEAEWPGFRGPARDDVVRGARIRTDWTASPPVEMWRREIGPGWSSFAVRGDVLFTQEQRGDEEIVAAYRVSTGAPVWTHRDHARFWESNGGAGPRATPALSGGRVFAMGATGILNALDERDGTLAWSRNVAKERDLKLPGWGFAGSPLVVGDVVIVSMSGALAAYDRGTGEPRWFVPSRGGGYSSPHPFTVDGAAQVLFMSGHGLASIGPADGKAIWEHAWEGGPIVQPAVIGGGDLLISSADMMGGMGMRRVKVSHEASGWTAREGWTSRGLKPYFSDFVVHEGHVYGFDGSILSCLDLEKGERKWKGGRYGSGQLLLLPEQDALLVLSEEGDLALVSATPDQFTELARRKSALSGKTWNHHVLVRDVLLVRNGEEMAAFRLALAQ